MKQTIYSHRHLNEAQLLALLQRLPASAKGIHLALPTRKAIGARPRQVFQTMPQHLDLTGTLEGRFFWQQGELRWFACQRFHQGRHQRLLHTVAIGDTFPKDGWETKAELEPTDQELTTHLWPLMPQPASRDLTDETEPGLLSVRTPNYLPFAEKTPPLTTMTLTLRRYRLAGQSSFWRWLTMEEIHSNKGEIHD